MCPVGSASNGGRALRYFSMSIHWTNSPTPNAYSKGLAGQPRARTLDEIIKVFDPPVPTETVRLLLADLTAEMEERQHRTGAGRIRLSVPDPAGDAGSISTVMTPEKAAGYSRAVLETLAIIAYRQPAERAAKLRPFAASRCPPTS